MQRGTHTAAALHVRVQQAIPRWSEARSTRNTGVRRLHGRVAEDARAPAARPAAHEAVPQASSASAASPHHPHDVRRVLSTPSQRRLQAARRCARQRCSPSHAAAAAVLRGRRACILHCPQASSSLAHSCCATSAASEAHPPLTLLSFTILCIFIISALPIVLCILHRLCFSLSFASFQSWSSRLSASTARHSNKQDAASVEMQWLLLL